MKLGSQSPSKFLLCQPEHMASIPEVTRWLLIPSLPSVPEEGGVGGRAGGQRAVTSIYILLPGRRGF